VRGFVEREKETKKNCLQNNNNILKIYQLNIYEYKFKFNYNA